MTYDPALDPRPMLSRKSWIQGAEDGYLPSFKDRVNAYYGDRETTAEVECGHWPDLSCPDCGSPCDEECPDCKKTVDTMPDLW